MDPQHLFQDPDTPQPRLVCRLRRLGVGLAAFVLTTLGLRFGLVSIGFGTASSFFDVKWRQFEACADECDVLFFGTSRVQRHLDTRAMHDVWGRRGLDCRAYNFGLPRMSILEADELLRRLASRRPRRLKAVVFEPTLYLFDPGNWASDRDLATHDWERTLLAVRNTLASERRRGSGAWQRLRFAWPHVMSFLCRSVNLGSAASLVFPPPSRPNGSGSLAGVDELAGFLPLPASSPTGGSAALRGGWQLRFTRFLTHDKAPDWRGAALSGEESAFFDDLLARIRDLGARPVFLLGPRVKRDSHTAALLRSHEERYGDVPLLDYLRGRGYEEIYRLDYWHDFDHLNAHGAAIVSSQVAHDLTALLRSQYSSTLMQKDKGHAVR
ncbi:MAG TPA: hypothetical protein VND64_22615 [Pirellulales bacterium]|nr:hypothetical protein [Pirellulales bacterium]